MSPLEPVIIMLWLMSKEYLKVLCLDLWKMIGSLGHYIHPLDEWISPLITSGADCYLVIVRQDSQTQQAGQTPRDDPSVMEDCKFLADRHAQNSFQRLKSDIRRWQPPSSLAPPCYSCNGYHACRACLFSSEHFWSTSFSPCETVFLTLLFNKCHAFSFLSCPIELFEQGSKSLARTAGHTTRRSDRTEVLSELVSPWGYDFKASVMASCLSLFSLLSSCKPLQWSQVTFSLNPLKLSKNAYVLMSIWRGNVSKYSLG